MMPRILIADDHTIVREGIKQILSDEFSPLEVGEAGNTTSLIEMALNQSWDLIITDITMPGGGGFYALEKIKSSNPAIPVILISSCSEEHYYDKAARFGAAKFILKDYLSHELADTVQKILGEKRIV